MNDYQEQLNRPWVRVGIAFVVGAILGLVVLGWWLFPVQWTDASPEHLRADLQEDYLRMAIDSYTLRPDPALAQFRIDELGAAAAPNLEIIKKNNGAQDPATIAEFDKMVNGTAAPLVTVEGTPAAVPTTAPVASTGRSITLIMVLLCVLTLVIGAVLFYLLVFRNRQGQGTAAAGATIPRSARTAQAPAYTEAAPDAPVVQYLSTYTVGNDLYDDSFSIDSPTGEFLGECGVGISETIGVGDPKKVTAFEVWLFDKNDIQTVTKVLMSAHAFNDPVISQRLASKGEPVLAEPGKRISLETATLQLEARVVSMSYGQGALPANSNFDQVTLELAVWPKPAA